MSTSVSDRKMLWGRAGGECSFPECAERESLQEAHINARADGGPRGDVTLDQAERDRYANLILLCPNHHKAVDSDTAKWNVDSLIVMKRLHEQDISSRSAQMTEFEGEVNAEGKDGDSVTGAKITKPTRFKAGTRITAKGDGVRNVTGLHIGGDDDG